MVLVQKEMQNAYIGEYGWHPSSDVLAYFPLDSEYQLNSYDGTKTLTASGSWYSFDDNAISFSSDTTWLYYSNIAVTTDFTVFWWFRWAGKFWMSTLTDFSWGNYRSFWETSDTYVVFSRRISNISTETYRDTVWWHSFVMVCTSWNNLIYIDWTLIWNNGYWLTVATSNLVIDPLSPTYSTYSYSASKVWVSNSLWTADDALNFHNKTKDDYIS